MNISQSQLNKKMNQDFNNLQTLHDEANTDQENSQPMSLLENFKTCLYLGVTSFGGPIAHIGMYNKIFIQEKKIITEKEFMELFAICNVIPGPTSSQLLTAIATIKTRSLLGGIISFLCFNMPALIVMIIAGSIIKQSNLNSNVENEDAKNSYHPNIFLLGLTVGIWQGAVALVLQAALTLNKKISNSNLQSYIVIASAVFFLIINKYYMMILLMLMAGSVSLYYKESEFLIKKGDSINIDQTIPFLGLPAILTLIIIYSLLLLFNFLTKSFYTNFYLMESFFRIGASVIGGGHVVIPLIFSEFNKIISDKDILTAFSVVSILPGPMFNISGYIGTIINGVLGGILSAFFIFLPGMLFLFASLKFLSYISDNPNLQFFIRGVSSAAIGFIFTSCAILMYDSCYKNCPFNFVFGIINVGISYVLLTKYNLNVVVVLAICAAYAILISSILV
jgi:chromate transporter